MTNHPIGTAEEHTAARLALLMAEKEHTRRGDELARQRRQLPWVRVGKTYTFDTDGGPQTLADLFDGRSQLLVYHFMFGPGWTEGCPICSYWADSFDGAIVHMNHRDVTMVCASRAPLDRLAAYKRRMGWSFPWVSSLRNDFNLDYGVSLPVSAGPSQPEMPRGPEVGAGHRYNFTSSPSCFPIASSITSTSVCPVAGSTKAGRAASQSSLKLFECAETQIWRTGEFGLTTNFAGGSSNSIASAPALKSASKSCLSEAAFKRL